MRPQRITVNYHYNVFIYDNIDDNINDIVMIRYFFSIIIIIIFIIIIINIFIYL